MKFKHIRILTYREKHTSVNKYIDAHFCTYLHIEGWTWQYEMLYKLKIGENEILPIKRIIQDTVLSTLSNTISLNGVLTTYRLSIVQQVFLEAKLSFQILDDSIFGALNFFIRCNPSSSTGFLWKSPAKVQSSFTEAACGWDFVGFDGKMGRCPNFALPLLRVGGPSKGGNGQN